MSINVGISLAGVLTFLSIAASWGTATEAPVASREPVAVDYDREVRPILAKNCFACHGQDEEHRAKGLRLDRRAGAVAELADGLVAVVAGDPEASELIVRVTDDDESLRMPPRKSGPRLPRAEVETLRRWIDQGASYAEHWSFVPPRDRPLPQVSRPDWPRNGIDRWILARLDRDGIAPAPAAEPAVLLRRLSLDLRGLPPSIDEIAAFDHACDCEGEPDAYEKAVDQFLAEPAYGERWARVWLDLARYADSAGYGSDPLRPDIYRYRDWVIDALNRNLPYDRFTIEQIAGDLLPGAADAQRIATAFQRNTMTNTEGGTDDEEFRVAAIKDRVDTTGQVFMGLTFGCAKCHNHKYDPITQDEYYRLYAFYNQTADADRGDEAPVLPAPTPSTAAEVRRIDERLAFLKRGLDTPTPALDEAQARWEAELGTSPVWDVLAPGSFRSEGGATLEVLPDRSIRAAGKNPDVDTVVVEAETSLNEVRAIRLEALPDPMLPAGGSGRGRQGRFALTRVKVEVWPVRDDEDDDGPGSAPVIVLDEVRAIAAPRPKEPFATVLVLKTTPEVPAHARLSVSLEQRSKVKGANLGRFRLSVTTDRNAVGWAELPAELVSILNTPVGERSDAQRKALARYHRSIAPELKPVRDEIARLEKARPRVPAVPVMEELPAGKMRETHLLNKGNFLDPGPRVEPGVPAAFPGLPEGAPVNRLGLALWLVDARNPLTARVAVNRLWAQIFGIGLVETEEDFGTQGDPPSHPELLDWLARQYVRSGWDTKALVRLIVTSATYRQSSRYRPELKEVDPRNRLLARAPRYRLEAEMVRDQALALSGLLSRKVGGPSVFPPQPEGLWQAAFNGQRTWATSDGADRHRRGLYTFWRRTVPYPSMATFDAPSRELCTVRRVRTNTPLQAFVTLNDPVYVEAAQALARRIVREGGDSVADRAEFGLKLCLGRSPDPGQVDVLKALYERQYQRVRIDPKAAGTLATEPIGPLPTDMDPAELAAWTAVANVLLNLDGVLMKG